MDGRRGQQQAAWRVRGSELWSSLLAPHRPLGGKELLGLAAVLICAGLIVYAPHLGQGGFYADDWGNAAAYRFADPPRYWSSVAENIDLLGGRPGLALLLPVPHALFGTEPGLHLGLALGLGFATALCLYLLLRTLSLAPLHAGSIAVLSLLFPWSDAIRLWATAGINTVAVCFFLLGLVLALRGLQRSGRSSVAMHAGADTLYLLSVLTYEAAAGAAIVAGFLYLGRAPIAIVTRRWLADVAVVFAALFYSLATTVERRHVGSLAERVGDVPEFVQQAAVLAAKSLLPLASLGRAATAVVLLVATLVVGIAFARARRQPDSPLRDWLRLIAVALVGLAAAYFMFLGSGLSPDDLGIDMRVNVFAGLAFCLLAYAVVAIACSLVFRTRSSAAAATLVIVAAIALGYAIRVRDDQNDWRRAAELQNELLRSVDRQLLPLPHAATVLSFGFPAQAGPEVPVFEKPWDLRGAVELRAGDSSIRTFPVYSGVSARCRRQGVVVKGPGSYGTFEVGYGKAYFLDVRRERGLRVRSSPDCDRALRTFRPGPLRDEPHS